MKDESDEVAIVMMVIEMTYEYCNEVKVKLQEKRKRGKIYI